LVVGLLDLDSLDQSRRSRLILRTLMKIGSSVVKERLIQMITDLINNDNDFQAVSYSIICGLLDNFDNNRIQKSFEEMNYEYLIDNYSYTMPLFLYQLIKYDVKVAQQLYKSKKFLLRYLIPKEVDFFLEFASNIDKPIKICLDEYNVPLNVPIPPAVFIKDKRIIRIHISDIDSCKVPKSAENLPLLEKISLI